MKEKEYFYLLTLFAQGDGETYHFTSHGITGVEPGTTTEEVFKSLRDKAENTMRKFYHYVSCWNQIAVYEFFLKENQLGGE